VEKKEEKRGRFKPGPQGRVLEKAGNGKTRKIKKHKKKKKKKKQKK